MPSVSPFPPTIGSDLSIPCAAAPGRRLATSPFHHNRILRRGDRLRGFALSGCLMAGLLPGLAGAAPDTPRMEGPRQHFGQADSTAPVSLARYAEVRAPSCQPLMAPVVTLEQRPAGGRLWVAQGTTVLRVRGCPPLKTPMSEVMYDAGTAAGFQDVGWRVQWQWPAPRVETVRGRVTATGR